MPSGRIFLEPPKTRDAIVFLMSAWKYNEKDGEKRRVFVRKAGVEMLTKMLGAILAANFWYDLGSRHIDTKKRKAKTTYGLLWFETSTAATKVAAKTKMPCFQLNRDQSCTVFSYAELYSKRFVRFWASRFTKACPSR